MRSFSHTDFGDVDLSAVSVVLPAKECAATVGPIVESIAAGQVLVVDAASSDGTAAVAERAGAEVVQEADLLPQFGPVLGKGDAMWRSLAAVRHDIVVFVDADTTQFDPHYVAGLAGPLLMYDEIQFVKGAYHRPFVAGETVVEGGGGRVTQLMARPLLRSFYPELAELVQPLAGEFAGRRQLFESLPWATGYAAEIALDIDVWREAGSDAIAQVDIGERRQPHQSLAALSDMATTILQLVCIRLAREGRMDDPGFEVLERPPLVTCR